MGDLWVIIPANLDAGCRSGWGRWRRRGEGRGELVLLLWNDKFRLSPSIEY